MKTRIIVLSLVLLGASYPDPKLTPGDILTQDAQVVCKAGYSQTVRHTSRALKMKVRIKYGIKQADSSQYVLDHLISLEIGGADSVNNLWPQDKIEARRKDFSENWLHRQVCAGRMSLKTAQYRVIHNWQEIYKKEHKR